MSNNFDGPIILDSAALNQGYLGTGGRVVDQSAGPRISGGAPADPNGVLVAPQGSLHLAAATLWQNTDGVTAWSNIIGSTMPVVFSIDVSPAAGVGSDNIFIVPYTIVGGEILSVVLVTNDSGQSITGGGTLLINYGITDNGAGQKLVRIEYPNTGPGRAGDSLIAVRLYKPL